MTRRVECLLTPAPPALTCATARDRVVCVLSLTLILETCGVTLGELTFSPARPAPAVFTLLHWRHVGLH